MWRQTALGFCARNTSRIFAARRVADHASSCSIRTSMRFGLFRSPDWGPSGDVDTELRRNLSRAGSEFSLGCIIDAESTGVVRPPDRAENAPFHFIVIAVKRIPSPPGTARITHAFPRVSLDRGTLTHRAPSRNCRRLQTRQQDSDLIDWCARKIKKTAERPPRGFLRRNHPSFRKARKSLQVWPRRCMLRDFGQS
jgi:hypothetical protein